VRIFLTSTTSSPSPPHARPAGFVPDEEYHEYQGKENSSAPLAVPARKGTMVPTPEEAQRPRQTRRQHRRRQKPKSHAGGLAKAVSFATPTQKGVVTLQIGGREPRPHATGFTRNINSPPSKPARIQPSARCSSKTVVTSPAKLISEASRSVNLQTRCSCPSTEGRCRDRRGRPRDSELIHQRKPSDPAIGLESFQRSQKLLRQKAQHRRPCGQKTIQVY